VTGDLGTSDFGTGGRKSILESNESAKPRDSESSVPRYFGSRRLRTRRYRNASREPR
jgi:hypothetical protein